MTRITTSPYKSDWRWAAAGAAGAYATGLLIIFNTAPFVCGGLAVASVWSFFNSIKKNPKAKPLHQFIPSAKPVNIKTDLQ